MMHKFIYLALYCDMDSDRAMHFLMAANGEKIPGATMSALKQGGLIAADCSLTKVGTVVHNLVLSIEHGTFEPKSPCLPMSVLDKIDIPKAAQMEICKQGYSPRLRTLHLKALRAVLRHPGTCLGHLTPTFRWDTFEHLKALGLVRYPALTAGQKYFAVDPTADAVHLFRNIARTQGFDFE
jgi:hypothetical protein